MRRLLTILALVAFSNPLPAAATADDQKATALVAAARTALGGDAALSPVHGLTVKGTFQRQVGDRRIDGELTLDLAWPDRMLRTESMSPMGDATIVTTLGINGDRLIRDSRIVGGGPGLMLRIAPGGGGPDAEAQAVRNQRAEMIRLTLLLLLTSSSVPLEYTYGGEAEASDGKADVVDVTGPGSFAVRLFLDRTTHRPLLLQYRGMAPRITMQTRPMPASPGAAGPESLPPPPPAEPVEISLFLDDYREVDGMLFPHLITRSIDGATDEEWTFKTFSINPAFKADAFAVSESRRERP